MPVGFFSCAPSCLLIYLVYLFFFLTLALISILAVEKGCVQQLVVDKYLTGSILGTINNVILKLIDAFKIQFQMRRHTAMQLLWLYENIRLLILFLENRVVI